ncbi:MAG TPA: hypothetical protein VK611_23955 [Acidimicrobiales bacterium]|nr:hypothetical protein [Acidimicrobiales bacterium]
MLSTLVPIVAVAGGLFVLWQAALRWRAFGTDQVRAIVAEARTTFYDITARGELDRSEFQTGDRHTVDARLQDLHGQLHDRVLQDRVDHLLTHVRSAWASAPEKWFGVAWVSAESSARVTSDSPERQAQVQRQVEAARAGLVEVDSVIERCNQLDRLIVRP